MKRPVSYLTSVIVSLLLIFLLIGVTAGGVAKGIALNVDACIKLIETQELPKKVHDNLTAYYQEQSNATGIPLSVYEPSITEEQAELMIRSSIDNVFVFLHGETDSIGVTHDFSRLEADMTAFFEAYAEENGYQKDDRYDEVLTKAITSAKQNILTTADVFRFATLEDSKLLTKAKAALPLVDYLLIASIVGTVVMLALLVLMHRKNLSAVLYWSGCASFCASLLMLLPAAYLQETRWFDRFALKSDQIFAAVTGYLYSLTGAVIVIAVIGLVLACLLFGGCAFLQYRAKKSDDTPKSEQSGSVSDAKPSESVPTQT